MIERYKHFYIYEHISSILSVRVSERRGMSAICEEQGMKDKERAEKRRNMEREIGTIMDGYTEYQTETWLYLSLVTISFCLKMRDESLVLFMSFYFLQNTKSLLNLITAVYKITYMIQ